MRATDGNDETLAMGFAPQWPVMTERLLLRAFDRDDLAALLEIHSNEANARYLYNEPRTPAQVEDLLERKIAGSSVAAEGEWLSAAAVLRSSNELVCDLSLLWASDLHKQGELGFITHPMHQGHGYATEAARPLLAFAFETLGLHRVVGRLEARNVTDRPRLAAAADAGRYDARLEPWHQGHASDGRGHHPAEVQGQH